MYPLCLYCTPQNVQEKLNYICLLLFSIISFEFESSTVGQTKYEYVFLNRHYTIFRQFIQ